MSSRLITDHLPLLAGAPNGVKKLRELILELAVRGKLVAQDADDAPASKLISLIAAERSRLEKEGSLKKKKQADIIPTGELPFKTPPNWEWVRLESIVGKFGAGSTPLGGKQGYVSSGIKFLRSQNIWNDGLRLDDVALIPDEVHQKMAGTHVLAGDLLFNITGASIGRCAVVPEEFDQGNVSQHVTIVRPLLGEMRRYLHIVMISRLIQTMVMDVQVGVSREGLSIGKLAQFAIPLPPANEQLRIVAKVDELMALCDRLETRQSDAQAAHARLVNELLGSLLQARDAEDFAECWGRVKGIFDVLFTTEQSLMLLKQTILQLGVMGLLVDESTAGPSSSFDLLKEISIHNGKPALSVQPIWKTPSAWTWTQLASILVYGPKNGISPKPVSHATPVRCLTLGATTRGQFNESCYKFVDLDPISAQKYLLKSGDLLIQRANSIDHVGVSAIYDGQDDVFIYPDLMMRMRVAEQMFLPFVHMCLSALPCREYLRSRATGTQGNMPKVNQGTVSETPIPVPPIEVQQRIVAKVDELMALCDRIRAKLTRAGELNERLAGTLVGRAVL